MREWQVQEAKSRLSELIGEAERGGPQAITRHGRPVAVLLSQADFDRLTRLNREPLISFLQHSRLDQLEIPGRDSGDRSREVDF
jgi:prevent-host-death family protein